jgi:hypothetical protein
MIDLDWWYQQNAIDTQKQRENTAFSYFPPSIVIELQLPWQHSNLERFLCCFP